MSEPEPYTFSSRTYSFLNKVLDAKEPSKHRVRYSVLQPLIKEILLVVDNLKFENENLKKNTK